MQLTLLERSVRFGREGNLTRRNLMKRFLPALFISASFLSTLQASIGIVAQTSAASSDTTSVTTGSINTATATAIGVCVAYSGSTPTVSDSTNGGTSFGANTWTLASTYSAPTVKISFFYSTSPTTS